MTGKVGMRKDGTKRRTKEAVKGSNAPMTGPGLMGTMRYAVMGDHLVHWDIIALELARTGRASR